MNIERCMNWRYGVEVAEASNQEPSDKTDASLNCSLRMMAREICFLFLLGHVVHVTQSADLVIRIPGGGQPLDGFYRLDYRWELSLSWFYVKYFNRDQSCHSIIHLDQVSWFQFSTFYSEIDSSKALPFHVTKVNHET